MDYIDAFKNLRTNNKYGRKSPHKAVLMLTVIELYERNIISENEIVYDDTLKSLFIKIWNKVLPNEPLFHPDAYLPFWYLQGDSFWHIVPIRGKEEILSLMRDNNIKPSEAKLYDSVKCAELDEDLYFLMTLPSGRSSLKKVLLETYTDLSERQIDRLTESVDNSVDYSASALSEYEKILSQNKDEAVSELIETDSIIVRQFKKLNEDLQIVLNIDYFSFLKKHRKEREMFKEVFPTVYDLFDHIVNLPVKQGDISPSLAIIYDNFLSDLKISLMSEDDSMELIDKISSAIDILRGINIEKEEEEKNAERSYVSTLSVNAIKEELLDFSEEDFSDDLEIEHVYLDSHGKVMESFPSVNSIPEKEIAKEDRKGKPWTLNEEELITLYYRQGLNFSRIADLIGRTEVSIKARLAKLGLIDYVYGQDNNIVESEKESPEGKTKESDFTIENTYLRSFILNKNGKKVFSTEGIMKFINGKLYRFNLKYECFTVKRMEFNGEVWMKGAKKIVAYPQTELYKIVDKAINICEIVQDINDSTIFEECKLKVNGLWFKYDGTYVESIDNKKQKKDLESKDEEKDINYSDFSVKIGDTLKLFPSQLVGTVINLRIDSKGHRKIVVKTDDGSIVESYDDKYLYQKLYKTERKTSSKPAVDITRLGISKTPIYSSKVRTGSWIEWKPSGTVGKVIGFKSVGSVQKIVVQSKDGSEIEVYDNPKAYDIIRR